MKIVTIGGYGFTEGTFVAALKKAGVQTLVDVRQRRGMRGAKYAFLNSLRLQQILQASGIAYIHALTLAPSTNVRDVQKADDQSNGIGKRDRLTLSPLFEDKYRSEVLEKIDRAELVRTLGIENTLALFCVEKSPCACHRLPASKYLAEVLNVQGPVEHIIP
ncbi:DUF488 family protein [Brevundimonas sp.]